MPLPHDERFPVTANPEIFQTGSATSDPEDALYDPDAELLEDLDTMHLWDDIEMWTDADAE